MRCASVVYSALVLSFFFACVFAAQKTLVIVDDMSVTNTHSKFFNSLTANAHHLDFYTPNAQDIEFQKNGVFLYDSLILFAPRTEDWNEQAINPNQVLSFIDQGHNVLIAGDINVNFFLEEVADKCGARFGPVDYKVFDHINFDKSNFHGDHSLIITDNIRSPALLDNKQISNVLYEGNGLLLSKSNRLVFPILSGSPSSYCAPDERVSSTIHAAGSSVGLVVALQARNNARVVISGSTALFSNKFFEAEVSVSGSDAVRSGNQEFVAAVTKWNFGNFGILRIKSVSHHRAGETEPQSTYTIKDQIQYTIEIEELRGNKWGPYSADDAQIEFQMLDPYIRANLRPDGKGKFTASWTVPDVYGIYTFKFDYHRVGYTAISDRTLVTVRPFRHDEYERYIPSAFPYYASAFSMMGGVSLFTLVYLFSKK